MTALSVSNADACCKAFALSRNACLRQRIKQRIMKSAFTQEANVSALLHQAEAGAADQPAHADLNLRTALRTHWPEYLMEAAELGLFMMSACVVVALLEHPVSPFNRGIPDAFVRRALTG